MINTINLPSKGMNVCIIEDHEIYSERLSLELAATNLFGQIQMDNTGRAGLESAKAIQPNIVLLDFQLSDLTGLEVAKRIKSHNEAIKIFMLTAHTEVPIIKRIIEDNHVDAVAVKGSRYFELNFIASIIDVINGGTYLEPTLLKKLRESKNYNGLSSLTNREFELFIQVNIGKSDQRIATDLSVEVAHVKNMKSKIAKKIKGDNLDRLLINLIDNVAVNDMV